MLPRIPYTVMLPRIPYTVVLPCIPDTVMLLLICVKRTLMALSSLLFMLDLLIDNGCDL